MLAELSLRLGDRSLRLARLAQIRGDVKRLADAGRAAAADRHHERAALDHQPGRREADAGAPAGDQDDLACRARAPRGAP